jgi:2-methylcitrate dehydratase PrpD
LHASIDAARAVVKKHNLGPSDIEYIKVAVNKYGYELFGKPIKTTLKNITDAQFSAAYVVAAVIVDGKLDLDNFTDEAIRRPDILQLARKIRTEIDPDIERRTPRYPPIASPGHLVIKAKDGKIYEEQVDFAKGNPKNPMTIEELRNKFFHCASYSARPLPRENLDKVVSLVDRLEEIEDVTEIMTLLIG